MKFPARIYLGKDRQYIALYNHYPDVHVAVPSLSKSQRLTHISYSEGGKRAGIDVFCLDKQVEITWETRKDLRIGFSQQVPEVAFFNSVKMPKTSLEEVDKKQDIGYQLVTGAPEELSALVRADVQQYCKRPATTSEGTRVYTDRIIPVTKARRIKYPEKGILEPGKQEFFPECLLVANLDFALGCISGWVPGESASFDGETFTGFYLNPFGECSYCYASPKHRTFPKNMFILDRDRLKAELLGDARLVFGSWEVYGKHVDVLRLGKRTEAGSRLTRPELLTTLEGCLEAETQAVMPTKYLEFDRTVAELSRRTRSTLLFSLDWNPESTGASAYGCDNEFRIHQALAYHRAEVNSVFYLLIHAHAPPGNREARVLNLAREVGMPVQLLPERFTSKDLMHKCTGYPWDFLKRQTGDPLKRGTGQQKESFAPYPGQDYCGSYHISSGVAIPEIIHPDWLKIIRDNKSRVRMCHHNNHTGWCGACFLEPGFITSVTRRASRNIKQPRIKLRKLPLWENGD